jgi:hypothetical protein
MDKEGRYSTSELIEDQSEPGSNGQVLKNLHVYYQLSAFHRCLFYNIFS